jgi:hypothetical protein
MDVNNQAIVALLVLNPIEYHFLHGSFWETLYLTASENTATNTSFEAWAFDTIHHNGDLDEKRF